VNKQLREQLLGYLLDALEDEERQQIEQQLEDDPSLIAELQTLRMALEPLAENYEDFEPPAGLAQRACSRVDERRQVDPVGLAGGSFNTGMTGSFASRSRISVADVVVSAGIVLAAVLIFFPVIANSRYDSRLIHCQENLRQMGVALVNYSDKLGGGFFPAVASQGNRAFAGIYAPTLIEAGYLNNASNLICPSSPLPEQGTEFRVPTLKEIDSATPHEIFLIQQSTGVIYGYTLGVMAQGNHVAPKNQGRANFGLMADTPRAHSGRGRNVLYEDGHLRFIKSNAGSPVWIDDPFQNRLGVVEAGVDENDSVIASSWTPPFSRNGSPSLED
jgi:hypothetical protein